MPVSFVCKTIPDPSWAEYNLERLKEAHPSFPWDRLRGQGFFLLQILLGFSPYATNILLRREEILKLFLKDVFPTPEGPKKLWLKFLNEGVKFKEWRPFALWLRRKKQEEIIKILVQDLAGWPLTRTTYCLSRLADFLVKAAYAWLNRYLFPAQKERLLVFALGKWGGRELNYSSDIDLVYFYDGDLDEKEVFSSLARELTRLLDTIVDGERLFRVDLRLRPCGKDGELVYTLKSGVSYYFYQSHPFERLALIKARPITGRPEVGKSFLKALRPALYPRFLDYAFLEHLKDLKDRIAKEAAKKGAENDLKLGPGGIREIEFFCQAFQMIYGGKDPGLRTRNTLWTLKKLARKKIIPPEEAFFLSEAYQFLRAVEHRIQSIHFTQTHTLPTEGATLLRIAKSLGFEDTASFLARLTETRSKVNQIFKNLFVSGETKRQNLKEEIEAFLEGAKPAGELAEILKLPPHLLEDVKHLVKAKGPLAPKRGPLLKDLFILVLDELAPFQEPEKALASFISFVERLGGRLSLFHALRYNPQKIRDLLLIFAKSKFLSRLLKEAPAAAEALFREEAPLNLALRLKGKDLEETLGLLRLVKNEEIFRLGYADLKGKLDLESLLVSLSRLAEEILSNTFALAVRQSPLKDGLCVFGLGKLGGRELGYRSDLDLVFITKDHDQLVPQTKTAQLFIHYLTVPLPEGPGYQVDTRLRPEGRKGPLVVSLKGFLKYYQEDAALWERLALTRLRPITGDLSLGKETVKRIKTLLASFSWQEKEAASLWEMRLLMEKERSSAGLINLKVGYGGLADLEFALQWLTLKNLPYLSLGNSTLKTIKKLEAVGSITKSEASRLRESYLFLRRLDQLLVLLLDKSGEEKEYTPEEISLAEEYLGKDILARLKAIQAFNRNFLKRSLGLP